MLDALPELEGQPALQTVLNVQQTGVPFKGDEQPVDLTVNGTMEQRYFNFSYTPVVEEGKVMGVLHVAIDVTHQVITRRQVEESEAKYRTLFESMDQGVCIIEVLFDEGSRPVDYRFLEVNPVFENQTGLKDAAGKTMKQLAPSHEDHWFQLYGKIALSGESMRFVERADALNRWYDVYAFRVGEAGENKVAILFTDITQRKKAEQDIRESETRFRSLDDESPMFVFIIDADPLAPVSYWNKTWLTYTGQTYEEALGRAWDGILHADDIPVVMHYYTPAFEKRESYYIPAVKVRRNDGEYRWHAFKGNPRFSATGEFDGYIGVGFDVHEQKITEENLEELVAQRTQDLQRANSELKRSNQNLEEFAHAASHDLKEPVRKIHFFTNQLREHLNSHLKETELRSFHRIENATQRMGNLIDDLLLYSHVSHRPHDTEAVDLNEKVQRVLEDLDLDIEEKKATINVVKLPLVKGYSRQLQQLFQNLISNALKYSKADVPPIIEITADKAERSCSRYHLISVKDNGIGFAQEYENKIFQMFTLLHGKAEYSGTGVGLSIVKKVVENHDGFIEVESVINEGSVFQYICRFNQGKSENRTGFFVSVLLILRSLSVPDLLFPLKTDICSPKKNRTWMNSIQTFLHTGFYEFCRQRPQNSEMNYSNLQIPSYLNAKIRLAILCLVSYQNCPNNFQWY